jgi:hypothetical protein
MIEAGDRLCFGVKSLQHSGRRGLLGQNHFHRHMAFRTVLHCAVHYAHPPPPDLFNQIIAKGSVIPRCWFGQRRID